MPACGCGIEAEDSEQRRVLKLLLAINAMMFVAELVAGMVSGSTALMADAMDMLADALVYSVSLYAVGRAPIAKMKAARLSGVFQILIGTAVIAEVLRRFLWGSEPEPLYMVAVGVLALAANVTCLAMIAKYRRGEVHMRASWIFSRNDVIANIGVILGGVLVHLFHSRLPDLLIGFAIALIVVRGGIDIIRDSSKGSHRE